MPMAIANAHDTFATMFVTPSNVEKIAPAPIIRKMLYNTNFA